MRTRILVATAACAVLMSAGPSTAATDRTVTLSDRSRTTSWSGDLAVGSYVGVPALYSLTRCAEPAFHCDTTLIRLSAAGDLTVTLDRGTPVALPYLGYSVTLYRSDAGGHQGAEVASDTSYGGTASAVGRGLAPGFYLAEIAWVDGAGSFAATATLTPRKPARRGTS
jgi:hypothetical protein